MLPGSREGRLGDKSKACLPRRPCQAPAHLQGCRGRHEQLPLSQLSCQLLKVPNMRPQFTQGLTCSGVSSSISAEARHPLRGVLTSWHIRDMNSDLASLAAFSRATVRALWAA